MRFGLGKFNIVSVVIEMNKMIKLYCIILLIVWSCNSDAFETIQHIVDSQQKIVAVDTTTLSTSYIYEKSIDSTYESKVQHFVFFEESEYMFPGERPIKAIRNAGFLNHLNSEGIAVLIDIINKKIILGFVKEKSFEIKEIDFPAGVNFIEKFFPTKEGMVFFSNNIWSQSLYFLNVFSGEISKQSVNGGSGSTIIDFAFVDDKKYLMLLGDSDKNILVKIYTDQFELVNSIEYSHQAEVLSAKILIQKNVKISLVIQSLDADLWPFSKDSEVYEVLLNMEDASILSKKLFVVDATDNPEIIDNMIFCDSSGDYHWTYRSKNDVYIKSSSSPKRKVQLPEGSFPRKSFLKKKNGKLELFISFLKYHGAYFNSGFGKESYVYECKE